MATMLTAADVTRLQTATTLWLPDTCQITRRAQSSDGMGGGTDTWPNQGSPVACRLDPFTRRSRSEEAQHDLILASSPWTVTLPAGTDVILTDRLIVTNAVYTTARTFEVDRVEGPETQEVNRIVYCTEHFG